MGSLSAVGGLRTPLWFQTLRLPAYDKLSAAGA